MRRTATWVSTALVTATMVALSFAAAVPASAMTDDERFTAYDDAAIGVTEEVGWLVRLGALAEPVPQSIADIPDNIGLPTLSRPEMIEELRRVDADGGRVMQGLDATGDPQSVAVRDTFRRLPTAVFDQLASGGSPAVPADGYRVAYDEILAVWGPLFNGGAQRVSTGSGTTSGTGQQPTATIAPGETSSFNSPDATLPAPVAPAVVPATAPGPVASPGATLPANGGGLVDNGRRAPVGNGASPTAANSAAANSAPANNVPVSGATASGVATPTTVAASAAVDASREAGASPAAGSDGGAPVVPIAIGAGALVLATVGGLVVVRRRRGRAVRPATTSSTPLAPERAEVTDVAEVAVGELFELSRVLPTLRTPDAVAAHAVTVVTGMVPGALVAVVDADLAPLAGELRLGASVLRPVLEAGSRVRTVVGDEAFVAAPLVTSGRVCGAVVVSRSGPAFSASVEHALHQVATLMASSLQAAFDHRDTERLAYVDGLTQVANRRRFDLDLADALRAAHAGARPVSLAMVDIDHFKRLNDTYGHQTGDAVLRQVAATIAANVRTDDVVYRYGGEEFAVLLPSADSAQAAAVVERVREAVQGRTFVSDGGDDLAVTVSVGVARSAADEPRDLLAAADGALYEAKDGGRNRVVIADR